MVDVGGAQVGAEIILPSPKSPKNQLKNPPPEETPLIGWESFRNSPPMCLQIASPKAELHKLCRLRKWRFHAKERGGCDRMGKGKTGPWDSKNAIFGRCIGIYDRFTREVSFESYVMM